MVGSVVVAVVVGVVVLVVVVAGGGDSERVVVAPRQVVPTSQCNVGGLVANTGGTVSVNGGAPTTFEDVWVDCGTEVTVVATADRGYCVKEWQLEDPLEGCPKTSTRTWTPQIPGTSRVLVVWFERDPDAPPAPPQNFTATAVAHDAVALSWDDPGGWVPVGYTVQWRQGDHSDFAGRLELPPGRRQQTVTGLTGGVEYVFRLTAQTTTGDYSDPAAVRATTPTPPNGGDLVLEVSVASYCIADEGTRSGRDRSARGLPVIHERLDVASVLLQWRLSGGTAPYVLRLLGEEHHGATGTVEVSCAIAGVDLLDLPNDEVSVVESGPKTVTVEAADAAGATTIRTVTIEIIEDAETAGDWFDGRVLEPGRTYYEDGLFLEIPEDARIAVLGSESLDRFYLAFGDVTDPTRMIKVLVYPLTGEESSWNSRIVYRISEDGRLYEDYEERPTDAENERLDRFLAGTRPTPFPEGDPRNEPLDPLAPSADGAAVLAAPTEPQCTAETATGEAVLVNFLGTEWSDRWRPYGTQAGVTPGRHGLPCLERVAVHPLLLVGEGITVCVEEAALDGLLVDALDQATDDWNNRLIPNPARSWGLDFTPFVFDKTDPDCLKDLDSNDTDYVRVFDLRDLCAPSATTTDQRCPPAGSSKQAAALAWKSSDPLPRIRENTLHVYVAEGSGPDEISAALERSLRHELGHFLGLADYTYGCWRLADNNDMVQPSVMSNGPSKSRPGGAADLTDPPCDSDAITPRDLADLHAIYHPLAVTDLTLHREVLSPAVTYWLLGWQPPPATPAEYNAYFIGIARRALRDSNPEWELIGQAAPNRHSFDFPASDEVSGFEYAVVGLTRGDHRRGEVPAGGLGLEHAVLSLLPGERGWTAGEASVSVSADVPLVVVGTAVSSVTEGDPVFFSVHRTGSTSSALTVNLTVSETDGGDMINVSQEGSRSVEIPEGASSITFSVATEDDDVDEDDSTITVAINAGADYRFDPSGSASVTVVDNDLAPAPGTVLLTRDAVEGEYYRRSDDQYMRPIHGNPVDSYVIYWGLNGIGGRQTVDICDSEGTRYNDFLAAGTNWRGTFMLQASTDFDCAIVAALYDDVVTVQIDGTSDVWSFQCEGIMMTHLVPGTHQLYCVDFSQDGFAEPPASYGAENTPTVTVGITPDGDGSSPDALSATTQPTPETPDVRSIAGNDPDSENTTDGTQTPTDRLTDAAGLTPQTNP